MKKIFTNGVFDLFHEGHYSLLRRAKDLGDYLLVGVASDESCSCSKRKPLQPWLERANNVRKLPFVDDVVETPWSVDLSEMFFRSHHISLQVQGDTGSGFPVAEQMGILRVIGRTEGISTTKLAGIIDTDFEYLEGGCLNEVRRVFFENEFYVLKYSNRGLARKFPIILPDHRTRDEYDVVSTFRKRIDNPKYLVNPIYSDRKKLTIFESAPHRAETLSQRIIRDGLDIELLRSVVQCLTNLHNCTYDDDELRKRFASNDGFIAIKINLQCRQATDDPEFVEPINSFIDESLTIKKVLLHGDIAPKNILIWDAREFLFIDFEESGYADPALDVGYLLAHLFIQGVVAGNGDLNRSLQILLETYIGDFVGCDESLVQRINKYIGIFIISRLDSKAPATDIPSVFYRRLRSVARRLVLDDELLVVSR